MVRRLERRDLQRLDAFLRGRLPFSFPILGDMERAGPAEQGRELWGWFSDDELKAVLARHESAAHVCGPEESAVEELTDLMGALDGLVEVDGRLETVEPYAGKVPLRTSHRQYISYLRPSTFTPRYSRDVEVSRATTSEAESIAGLWCRRLTSDYRTRTAELLRARLMGTTDRIYIARLGGILVSTASTGQESPSLALIRCSYTDPDLRGLGSASACLSVLCRDLLAESKMIVVLTETLADARIYRNMGFVPAGLWAECRRR